MQSLGIFSVLSVHVFKALMMSCVCSVCSSTSQALPLLLTHHEKGWWLQAVGGPAEKAKTGYDAAITCCNVFGSQASTSTHPTPNKYISTLQSLRSLNLPA